jgi:hypothetical protein
MRWDNADDDTSMMTANCPAIVARLAPTDDPRGVEALMLRVLGALESGLRDELFYEPDDVGSAARDVQPAEDPRSRRLCMPPRYLRAAFTELDGVHVTDYADVSTVRATATPTLSEARLREYLGLPAEPIARIDCVDVLAVHCPPVTDTVLDASAGLGRPLWRARGT